MMPTSRTQRGAIVSLCLAAGLLMFSPIPAVAQQQTPTVGAASSKPPAPYNSKRWEADIARFEAADRVKPPAKGGIVFVGSSSIVNWKTLARDFPDVNIVKRGFGGSRLADSTYYADRIIIPYQPKTIVLYAGDNDLWAGVTPAEILRDFRRFVATVRRDLPDTRILFLSLKPSPARWKIHEAYEETNRRIQEWSAAQKNITFVNIYTPMLGTDGMPREELYVKDRLHMTPAGYEIWQSILSPLLKD